MSITKTDNWARFWVGWAFLFAGADFQYLILRPDRWWVGLLGLFMLGCGLSDIRKLVRK